KHRTRPVWYECKGAWVSATARGTDFAGFRDARSRSSICRFLATRANRGGRSHRRLELSPAARNLEHGFLMKAHAGTNASRGRNAVRRNVSHAQSVNPTPVRIPARIMSKFRPTSPVGSATRHIGV